MARRPGLREGFARGCAVPPRGVHQWPDGQGGQVTSLVMPAWAEGEAYGVKVINMAAGNAARGLPGLHASYLLFDAQTGVPRAVIDGDQLTLRRTAAASALAASYLARPDAQELLVDAGAAPIVFEAVTDLAAAAAQADIISCATLATEPVVRGAWLRPGQHLDLIGSFTPQMREADDDCFAGARLFVDVREALVKSGELIGPMGRGVFTEQDVAADLQALCRVESAGRLTPAERTVFKSVGTALEDLAAACLVWQACGGTAATGAAP